MRQIEPSSPQQPAANCTPDLSRRPKPRPPAEIPNQRQQTSHSKNYFDPHLGRKLERTITKVPTRNQFQRNITRVDGRLFVANRVEVEPKTPCVMFLHTSAVIVRHLTTFPASTGLNEASTGGLRLNGRITLYSDRR